MSAITADHEAFSRAVIALARAHKMNHIRLEFSKSFHHPNRDAANDRVITTWAEGRHGDESNILLECRASVGIAETQKEPT